MAITVTTAVLGGFIS
ncbi:unnamed protein product, partial [Calypogeia fissa]